MSYMLLIVEPQGQRATRTASEGTDLYERMLKFSASLRERGVLVASDALKTEAVRLRRKEGRVLRTDGPFAESKELIGGFFLLDCPTRAEALRYAEECPACAWASVEVREVGTCYE